MRQYSTRHTTGAHNNRKARRKYVRFAMLYGSSEFRASRMSGLPPQAVHKIALWLELATAWGAYPWAK